MLKTLRNKIQSLTETQQNIITIILILINLGIVIFWINFWATLPKTTPRIAEKPVEEINKPFQPGEIGEPKGGEEPLVELAPFISNTSGTIKEVQKDRLIILSDGGNFSDQVPREITLIFTDSTITFEPGQKISYQGLKGLKYLKIGDSISISSSENIRGKTEFSVNFINKLK